MNKVNPGPRSQWRKISTAPKDGSFVLAWADYGPCNGDCVDVAWFDSARGRWSTETGDMSEQPTHWMPLPEPPR